MMGIKLKIIYLEITILFMKDLREYQLHSSQQGLKPATKKINISQIIYFTFHTYLVDLKILRACVFLFQDK